MSDKQFRDISTQLLDNTINLTIQLNELLEKEYAVLKSLNASSLGNIADKKTPIAALLDQHNQQWLALLERHIGTPTPKKIKQFLLDYDNKHQTSLSETWGSLTSHARKCQRQNTINGTVIVLRNQAGNQILSILRGQTGDNSTYDTHGNHKMIHNGGHSLAKA